MKIYSVGEPWGDFLEKYGEHVVVRDSHEIKPDGFVVLWGGADISPSIYGHDNLRSYPNEWRDEIEVPLAKECIERGIPILGICRGAQMLCALAGGYLVQHATGHTRAHHDVITPDGERFKVNSLHHQMLAGLENLDHDLLAWTPNARSSMYIAQQEVPYDYVEPEAVWFPKIKGLGIQWHPEYMDTGSEATQFVYNQIDKLIIGG